MSTLLNLYVIITAAGFHTFLQSYNTITELSNIFFYCNPPLFIPVFFVIFEQEGMKPRRNSEVKLYFTKLPAILV